MATRKQKEDLLEALRFTPRSVEIMVSGYGGEIVMGRVDRSTYNYWASQDPDALKDFVLDWHDTEEQLAEIQQVPKVFRFVEPGSWYECDDVAHASGAEMHSSGCLAVLDTADNKWILETDLDSESLNNIGIQTEEIENISLADFAPETTIFVGQSIEKGTFFAGTVDLDRPFDPKLLAINYATYQGWPILISVLYNGEFVDGFDGHSTMGKSMNFEMLSMIDPESDSDWFAWEDREIDENHMTQWFPADDYTPCYPGEYQVQVESTLYPVQYAAWDLDSGWSYTNGERITLPIRAWRGVNYATC